MQLPEYARRINPKGRVQLVCDKCKRTRYAKLTVDFPGSSVLENSNLGDYEAACGVCGTIHNDGYNMWR